MKRLIVLLTVALMLSASAAVAVPALVDVTVIAHRGASGVRPENTESAFRAAAARGVYDWEADFRCTSTGTLVAAHDMRWDKQSTGTGLVRSRSWSYVKKQRARRAGVASRTLPERWLDEPHIHLADTLALVDEYGATLHYDSKTRDCETKALRVLQEAYESGIDIVFGPYNDAQRQLALDTTTLPLVSGHITEPASELDSTSEARAAVDAETQGEEDWERRILWISVRHDSVTPELVSAAHAEGRLLRVWTLRREPEFLPPGYATMAEHVRALHEQTQLDGIVTDNPDSRNTGI